MFSHSRLTVRVLVSSMQNSRVRMKAMRCYFLKNGVIRAVEVVRCATDEAGIDHALQLFENRKDEFAGIELWDGSRLVHQHPANARQSAQKV